MPASRESANAPAILAVLISARRGGDRELERTARRRLREECGIAIRFVREGRRQDARGR